MEPWWNPGGTLVEGGGGSINIKRKAIYSPTAESFGVSAQVGSGVVRGSPEVRFHEGSTRALPPLHPPKKTNKCVFFGVFFGGFPEATYFGAPALQATDPPKSRPTSPGRSSLAAPLGRPKLGIHSSDPNVSPAQRTCPNKW